MSMNTDILQGKWHQLKGSVKAQWGKLTDDELDRVDGDAEKLIGLVQERYGYEKQRADLCSPTLTPGLLGLRAQASGLRAGQGLRPQLGPEA
jgi:uncharacterized protein YjbJ (UPF0337 family)